MSCCPCIGGKGNWESSASSDDEPNGAQIVHKRAAESIAHAGAAPSFTFRELATATKHFTPDSLLGEGGIGRVYKGVLDNGGKAVAIKQLDRNISLKDAKEFIGEVQTLSLLRHPNLVPLVGYCADGDQRLLVHEYMPNGSLHDHLHGDLRKPLDWLARMRIASGAAHGLEYLHHKAYPPVIYRDLKSSSILLDGLMNPKLSDFGQAVIGPMGDTMPVASRVMGTYGYSSPEYTRNGELTLKSDVYSFGVVLLELITGRRALDPSKPLNEQNLVSWAQPMFKEQRRYPELVDPVLKGDYPMSALNQAVAIAATCIQEEASVRPLMADVAITLRYLADPTLPAPEVSLLPTPDDPNQPPSSWSSSTSSDEHVVETLQLGRSKTGQRSKAGSRCSSSGSMSSSSTGSDGHVVETLQLGRSKTGQGSKARSRCSSSSRSSSRCTSDGGSSSRGSSKNSRSSSMGGSGRSSSRKSTGGSSKRGSRSSSSGPGSSSRHGSDDSGSRRSSAHGSESD